MSDFRRTDQKTMDHDGEAVKSDANFGKLIPLLQTIDCVVGYK
ncbi:hypothetical protein [Bartonella koehlerae]|uniref:Uncharacterized protein n=1 Tax=Bartonella koehlerae C-29 TaxID=1134510 RepID=A0A067WH99_9HYPH|nr:hypothetical protein [Bartonella koehlerae]KEC56163.1 hypothetical protein O9A_00388 [Bartonella koehlerae C-29]